MEPSWRRIKIHPSSSDLFIPKGKSMVGYEKKKEFCCKFVNSRFGNRDLRVGFWEWVLGVGFGFWELGFGSWF